MSFSNGNDDGPDGRHGYAQFGGSKLFQATYKEGMGLVEEAARYLDGPGREQAKDLPRATALAYATESMRLTTRLMQVAAWLLVQKAVHEGDMNEEEALSKKYALGGKDVARATTLKAAFLLPDTLKDLVIRSESIFSRIDRLDRQIRSRKIGERNPLSSQRDRVEAFFRDTVDPGTTRH